MHKIARLEKDSWNDGKSTINDEVIWGCKTFSSQYLVTTFGNFPEKALIMTALLDWSAFNAATGIVCIFVFWYLFGVSMKTPFFENWNEYVHHKLELDVDLGA